MGVQGGQAGPLMMVQKLENEGVLTPGDLMPMVEILEKYTGGKGVILEHYDPEEEDMRERHRKN